MEQRDLLRHDRDRVAQGILAHLGERLPVDQEAAALHVVESLHQGDQRRLARPDARRGDLMPAGS